MIHMNDELFQEKFFFFFATFTLSIKYRIDLILYILHRFEPDQKKF